MRAIGIDLGTTNSVAAVGGRELRVLPSREGEHLTPSVVGYVRRRKSREGEIVAGRPALNNALRDTENTVFSVKRLMGRMYDEPRVDEVRDHFSIRLAAPPAKDAEDQGVKILLADQVYSPVQIASIILQKIKSDAELALGEPVSHAVITVPAYFEERQRKATEEAGRLAGLEVLQIVDEPTAAAFAFGAGRERERNRVLVYDLGGGTFDISIIQMTAGHYAVLDIEGDNWLGGNDFDETIVRRLIDWVKREYDYDPSGNLEFLIKARLEAEKAKMALSTQRSVEILQTIFRRNADGGAIDIELEVTRDEFEEDIRSMVERTVDLVHEALRRQELSPDDITEVLLVGGSTAVPLVHSTLSELFDKGKIKRHVNPMECVALGAGILAAGFPLSADKTETEESSIRISTVTAMDLGISAVRGDDPDAFVSIIPKGTPYPLREPLKRVFYPTAESQDLIRVPIYEGMSEIASLNEQQGVIEFPLPAGIASSTPVEVSFNMDRNRTLTVRIQVLGTELELEETVRRDRPRVRPAGGAATLLEDWREDLEPTVRMSQFFLDNYGEQMTSQDKIELEDSLRAAGDALERGDEKAGRDSILLMRNKMLASGIASQLFLAEKMMRGQPADVVKDLAVTIAAIRQAHANGDETRAQELARALRGVVAGLIAKRAQEPRPLEDRKEYGDRLRDKSERPKGGG